MDNEQHDFRKSRSGRLLIPRLKTWTGERVIVSKGGYVDIIEGKPDYTSTFQSERSILKNAHSFNLSQVLMKNQEIPQSKTSKSFSGCDSTKLLHPKSKSKVEQGKILETKNNAGPKKTPIKRSTRIYEKDASVLRQGTATPCNKMHCTMNENQRKEIVVTKTRTPSPRKTLRKQRFQQNGDINFFGPEFQPFVRLVRLLPEEILSLTEKKPYKILDTSVKQSANGKHKKKTNVRKTTRHKVPSIPVDADLCRKVERSSNRHRPQTVRETQKLLSVLNRSKDCKEFEDEAASTADFFKNSSNRTDMKFLSDAVELLNDDFESDDNLSIRTLSERESSPMSSAVSPIGSLLETDAETSGREDALLRGSPLLSNASEFHRARILHRNIKESTKLLKKAQNQSHYQNEDSLESLPIVGTSTPSSSQLLKPRMLRALERNIKKKVTSPRGKWDFSTYYGDNLLHVTVNSDSDSDESSTVDSLVDDEL